MEQTSESKKAVKFTNKVRRGLARVRSLLIDALDDNKPPAATIVASWKAPQREDFNQALAWIEQEEDAEAARTVNNQEAQP